MNIPQEYYDYYVGNKAEVYRKKWNNKNPEKLNLGWNWASFFFGGLWLIYRKMYREWLILTCASIALLIANVYLSYPFRIFRFIELSDFANLFACIFGDSLYQRKVYKVIKEQMGQPEDQIIKTLQSKGNVNIIACVLISFAQIVLFFITRSL